MASAESHARIRIMPGYQNVHARVSIPLLNPFDACRASPTSVEASFHVPEGGARPRRPSPDVICAVFRLLLPARRIEGN